MVRSAAAEVVDAAIDEANRRISRDENGNMLVEGLQVGITVGEDFGKDAMDAAVKNLKLQLDTAAITTADYYRELEKLRDNYLTRGSEEWWKYTKEVMEYEQKRVEEAKKANKEAFEEELHLLERKQKLGLISEQEYYIGMKYLRDSYFKEGTEEWQDYTEKLEDFVTKETQTLTDRSASCCKASTTRQTRPCRMFCHRWTASATASAILATTCFTSASRIKMAG